MKYKNLGAIILEPKLDQAVAEGRTWFIDSIDNGGENEIAGLIDALKADPPNLGRLQESWQDIIQRLAWIGLATLSISASNLKGTTDDNN